VRTKVINDGPERTYAIVFETGDEVAAGLLRFARDAGLTASRFTAIGAFSEVTLGYFEWEKKDYARIPIREQVEVLSLIGDIALEKGEPKVHAHAVVGKRDGSAHGGHLLEARVRPTLEVVLIESPSYLRRTIDPTSGLALIDIGQEE
jgi:predicted DNA-binding protein with PD1-like motif